jgi:hypothetical protein
MVAVETANRAAVLRILKESKVAIDFTRVNWCHHTALDCAFKTTRLSSRPSLSESIAGLLRKAEEGAKAEAAEAKPAE